MIINIMTMVLSAMITSDPHMKPPPLQLDRGHLHPPVLHSALGVLLPALGSLELIQLELTSANQTSLHRANKNSVEC